LNKLLSSLSLLNQKTWFHIFMIVLIVSIGYSNSIHNDFLMDDYVDLFSPEGAAYKSLGTIFLKPQGDIYRPFTHFFCWVAYNLFGTNPAGYHLANLCLFMLISTLFYSIVRVLTNNKSLAFLTSILFCLHPNNSKKKERKAMKGYFFKWIIVHKIHDTDDNKGEKVAHLVRHQAK